MSVEDIQQEINYFEWLESQFSAQDELLAAVVRNQRIQLMQLMMQSQQSIRPGGPSDAFDDAQGLTVPMDAVGITNRRIYEQDRGPATFQVDGTVFAATVEADEDLEPGRIVRVIGEGNLVKQERNVAPSLLGLAGSVGAGSYERTETDTDVSIQPDETKTVLRVGIQSADWVSVGTNDRTHSLYQYYIDDDALLDNPLKEPLGLYNDPYQFPAPLSGDREFRVEVTRQSSASGSADYFSKITYFE